MKLKFKEKITLAINDYNFGEEYIKAFNKDQIVNVLGVSKTNIDLPDSEYFDIHFKYKETAESVHESAFTILE